ncbi:MAG: hypothetical protein RBS99_02480 [Rhodospirillales bacterium]|jgi:hypothetical protein|nr:hypothetical protein [Rhodospirillales bacterium]
MPPPSDGRTRNTNWTALWLFVLVVGLIWLSPATILVMVVGMPPTVVAWIIDRSYQKSASYCVAGMNFCGLFPYLMDLWMGANSMKAAAAVVTDVFALLVIYGAAAFGWMIYITIPPVVGTFLTVMAQRRVVQLRTLQRQIIDEWGESVAHDGSRQLR